MKLHSSLFVLVLLGSLTQPSRGSAQSPDLGSPRPPSISRESLRSPASASSEKTIARTQKAYGILPMTFEANRGQTDARVEFLSRGPGYTLFLTRTGEAVLALRKPARKKDGKSGEAGSATTLRMKLVGASAAPRVVAAEELPGKANYFIGNDPGKWRANVPTYARAKFESVYPGVDLVYYGNQQQLEYDFVVAPGSDPTSITLGFEGAERLSLDDSGNLILRPRDGEVRFQKPVLYQEIEGVRREVSGRYTRKGAHQIGFQVAAYDPSRPLIIDPTLIYSTYLGGTGFDQAQSVAVDGTGSAYLAGFTGSEDFPTVNPYQAERGSNQTAFISKLNSTGSALVYSTYLGGSDSTAAFGIAVDAAGRAIVTGQTTSSDFPTVNAVQPVYGGIVDAFVTKFSSDGSALVYSTFLGGTGGDAGYGVAVDGAGSAFVAGVSNSSDFPTQNPIRIPPPDSLPDAFISKLDSAGSLIYSTYLGGSGGDAAFGIGVDPSGSAYATGQTSSVDFPTTPGVIGRNFSGGVLDGFVAKLNPAGAALVYGTYIGGSDLDETTGIAVNSSGEAWVTGVTRSTNFPLANPLRPTSAGLPDAFVTKLSATGSATFSSYLGGSDFDSGIGIALDEFSNAYVTGVTGSNDLPVVKALQPTRGGLADAYVMKLSSTGTLVLYSTYLGGSADDEGLALATAPGRGVLVTGHTASSDFPTKNPAQGSNGGGGGDAFATRIGGVDLFLRVVQQALALVGASPTSTNFTFRDSGPLKFVGGNAWTPVGTWTAVPPLSGTLSSLDDLNAWIGLKNSDATGARLDLRIELRRNGVLIAEGLTRCIQNLTRTAATAMPVAVPFGVFAPTSLAAGDVLSLSVSARSGTNPNGSSCGGPQSAAHLRFYFDSIQQASRFGAGLAP